MTMDFETLAELIDELVLEGQLWLLVYAVVASLILSFAVVAVFFFLGAIGLYRINRRLGNRFAWLAFIPGLSGYALGAAADSLKKRKPSNYCVHMLMLNLFYTVLNVMNFIYGAGRFVFLYEKLAAGGVTDTQALLERVFVIDQDDKMLYFLNFALQLLNYVVVLVTLLCFMRILKLYRRGGFLLLMCTAFVPQVMDVYLFAMRNSPLYPKPPVYRMPDGTLVGEGELDESEAQDIYPNASRYTPDPAEDEDYDRDETDADESDAEETDADESRGDPSEENDPVSGGDAPPTDEPKDGVG